MPQTPHSFGLRIVGKDLLWPGKGPLGVDDPVLAVEPVFERGKGRLVPQGATGPPEPQLSVAVGAGEPVEELASEEPGDDLDRKQVAGVAPDPAALLGAQAAAGDDAV